MYLELKVIVYYLILLNVFLIPIQFIVTPLLMDYVYDCKYEAKQVQKSCLDMKSKWSVMLFIIPLIGTNFMLVFSGSLLNLHKINIEYTDEYKEHLRKSKLIDEKNRIDSNEILKKYSEMPDL